MRKTVRSVISWWLTAMGPTTLLGIVLGAVVGASMMYSTSSEKVEASALIRVDQPIDPDQILTNTGPSADTLQSYVSGEMTYLASPGFAAAVGKALDETGPAEVKSVQNGQSSVITLSATADDFDNASRVVDAALRTYTDHAHLQIRERGQAAMDALTDVIKSLDEQSKADLQADVEAGAQRFDINGNLVPTNRQIEFATRISQLDQQRQSIAVQMERPAGVQVVQPPTKVPKAGAPSWVIGAIAGGLLGGLLALGAALAWRKSSRTIVSPSAVEEYVDNLLLPVVPLTAMTGLGEPSADDIAIGRTLYAQLPPPRSGRILVIGASAASGSAPLARLLTSAAAEHRDVTLVHLLDGSSAFRGIKKVSAAEDSFDDQVGETTTIIDGGSLDASATLPEVVEHANQIVIVAMVGRDSVDSVRMAHLLTRATGVPVSAVCTRGNWGSRQSRREHIRAATPPGRHHAVAESAIPSQAEPIR